MTGAAFPVKRLHGRSKYDPPGVDFVAVVGTTFEVFENETERRIRDHYRSRFSRYDNGREYDENGTRLYGPPRPGLDSLVVIRPMTEADRERFTTITAQTAYVKSLRRKRGAVDQQLSMLGADPVTVPALGPFSRARLTDGPHTSILRITGA